MKTRRMIVYGLILVLTGVNLVACAGGSRGKLPTVVSPTEAELMQTWRDYAVYYRGMALVYKLKDANQIVLDNTWVEVATEEAMAKSKINSNTWVKKILGQGDVLFGYLVQRDRDLANVKIIDARTVELYYHYVRTSGGP